VDHDAVDHAHDLVLPVDEVEKGGKGRQREPVPTVEARRSEVEDVGGGAPLEVLEEQPPVRLVDGGGRRSAA
jgi:hypothetical protein